MLFQIRLIRQAAEWGPRYKFWSCSDVDILHQSAAETERCGENGREDPDTGLCSCDRLWSVITARAVTSDSPVAGLERDAASLRIVPLMLTVVIKVSAYRSPPQQCPGTACLEAGSVIIRVLSF